MKEIILGCCIILSSCLNDRTVVPRDTGVDTIKLDVSDVTDVGLSDTANDTRNDIVEKVLRITSTFPENSSINVARDSILTVTFSEDVLAQSLVDEVFILKDDNNVEVPGVTKFGDANNVVVFEPDIRLDVRRTYTATLSSELSDLDGNPLGTNYIWSFTTANGVWGSPVSIDLSDFVQPDAPKMVFDQTGTGIAVWIQNDGNQSNIWSSRFDGVWGSAEPIFGSTLNGANPNIVYKNGNAIAVWTEHNGTKVDVWVNHFDGTKWIGAFRIDSGSANQTLSAPQIALDKTGKAMVVWSQSTEIGNDVFANPFNGIAWEGGAVVENDGSASNPQVAFNHNDSAILIFVSNGAIKATVYEQESWTRAQNIGVGDSVTPQLAADSKGNAIAVWGEGARIQSRFFDGTFWAQLAVPISKEGLTGRLTEPQIAFDDTDNAIVIWGQYDGRSKIFSNRFIRGAWNVPEQIEADDASLGDSRLPDLAVNARGEAMVVWQNGDAQTNIWANRFGGKNWELAGQTNSNTVISARSPQVSIDNSGNASVLWSQAGKIWASRFE